MTSSLTVVVDGGGSGCRLAAFDAQGSEQAAAHDGPASLTLGEEQAWRHIRSGLVSLARQLGETDDWLPARLWLGLAGSLQNERRRRFLALLPPGVSATIVTDGHAQLLGATGGEAGICLAIGTGSVLHWLDDSGRLTMVGGWGFPAGDEGSGAWLGSRLINAYLWYRDAPQCPAGMTPLFASLEKLIGCSVSDVQLWSTCKNPTQLAGLVPLIVAAATQGDELASSLLDHGARQCARLIDLAPDHLPVHLVGGLANDYGTRLALKFRPRLTPPRGNALAGLFALSQQADSVPAAAQRGSCS